MKIGILDIDTKKEKLGHGKFEKFPNLAVGKIYGYHIEQGDEVIYPYQGQKVDKLYISSIFSWTKPHLSKIIKFYEQNTKEIIIGGTGWDYKVNLPKEVEQINHKYVYELYGIDYGIGFTVRGCHVGCGFCVVWKKEGKKEYRTNRIKDLINPKSNHIVLLNNNSFAEETFFEDIEEIKELNVSVNWNQANDITLLTEKHAKALSEVRYMNFARTSKMLHFSWDQMIKRKVIEGKKIEYDMKKIIPEKIKMLREFGIPPSHLTFYTLIGFDTTLEEDLERFNTLHELGVNIYAMKYRDLTGKVDVDIYGNKQSPHVTPFRDWINGHAFRNVPFKEFDRYKKALTKEKQLVLF